MSNDSHFLPGDLVWVKPWALLHKAMGDRIAPEAYQPNEDEWRSALVICRVTSEPDGLPTREWYMILMCGKICYVKEHWIYASDSGVPQLGQKLKTRSY